MNEKGYSLPFKMESNGTKRYYGFAGLLAFILKDSMILPIDELESSLHPDLYEHFLLSFLMNSKDSQIIATTHNREILNKKDLFRNDAIWFTEKMMIVQQNSILLPILTVLWCVIQPTC